jgi:hypothetical protein
MYDDNPFFEPAIDLKEKKQCLPVYLDLLPKLHYIDYMLRKCNTHASPPEICCIFSFRGASCFFLILIRS